MSLRKCGRKIGMKIEKIEYRRLWSFGHFENMSIGLEATIGDGENLNTVISDLAKTAKELYAKAREAEETAKVDWETEEYKKRIKELQEIKESYGEIRDEIHKMLKGLEDEITRVEAVIEQKKVKDEIIEKLRRLRRALWGFVDDP